MKLTNKITLLFLIGYLLLLSIYLGQRIFFSIPELQELQRQSDFNEVERVVRALEYQKIEASRFTSDNIDQLRETIQMEFELFQFRDVGNNKELAALAPKLDVLEEKEVYRSNGSGYRWLKNRAGDSIALLRVSLSDAIYKEELIDSVSVLVIAIGTFTMILLRLVLGFFVIGPILHTSNHLKKVRDTSNYSLRLDDNRNDEIGELARECDNLVHYVHAQEQYLKEINQDLTKKTLEDGLTEVANRRHFDVKLELLWRAFSQRKQPVFLILIDVDNFKAFNDNYGHLKGDEALRDIANVLLSNVRVSTDMVARYGGEEFAILLSETDITGVKIVCEKLMTAIRTLNIPHEYSEAAPRVTVSMGVSGWIPTGENPEMLVQSADEALCQAKDAGRDCVQYHVRDDSISR